jgi:hypothetical protein
LLRLLFQRPPVRSAVAVGMLPLRPLAVVVAAPLVEVAAQLALPVAVAEVKCVAVVRHRARLQAAAALSGAAMVVADRKAAAKLTCSPAKAIGKEAVDATGKAGEVTGKAGTGNMTADTAR